MCIPDDWHEGYDNVIIAVTCENQEKANERLPILLDIKAKHKYIFVSPILEDIDLSEFLSTGQIELVSVGGESYENARLCDFSWVKHIKKTCDQYHVMFDFHQTGSYFKVNHQIYYVKRYNEYRHAKRAMQFLKENIK